MLFADRPSVQVFGLGGATTSAHHLSYLWDDIRHRVRPRLRVLNAITEVTPDEPLLLYDDNVGSGGQASTVVMQWLGFDRSQWAVSEEHVQPLPADIIARLKTCYLNFCFVTGRTDGLSKLLDVTEELLGRSPRGRIVVPTDVSSFDAAALVYGSRKEADRAAEIFRRAGTRALQDRKPQKSDDWIEKNSLGYGCTGGLTAFYYNTPTTTLTALWKDCALKDCIWSALFPRRPRL
jgi:hypothetical protein